jgi:hypothetical protein
MSDVQLLNNLNSLSSRGRGFLSTAAILVDQPALAASSLRVERIAELLKEDLQK